MLAYAPRRLKALHNFTRSLKTLESATPLLGRGVYPLPIRDSQYCCDSGELTFTLDDIYLNSCSYLSGIMTWHARVNPFNTSPCNICKEYIIILFICLLSSTMSGTFSNNLEEEHAIFIYDGAVVCIQGGFKKVVFLFKFLHYMTSRVVSHACAML